MNEIELLRNQLTTERRHVREVASACAAAHAAAPVRSGDTALEALRGASGEYLTLVLDWFDRRDQRLGELYARHPPADPGRTALATLGPVAHGREALERLKQAGPAPEAWQALAGFINGPWDARRDAIEALLNSDPRVADWRAFSGIDADSICQERALYGRVCAALPSGKRPGPA
jgi:hypothetical protein